MPVPQVTRKRVVFPEPRPGARRLYVVFNVPRASVLKPGHPALAGALGGHPIALDPLPPGYSWAVEAGAFGDRRPDDFPNVLVLDIHPGALGMKAQYSVASLGEKPELVSQVHDHDRRSVVHRSTGSPCYDTTNFTSVVSDDPAHEHVFGVQDYLDALRSRLDSLGADEHPSYRRFFFALDERTDANLREVRSALEWHLHASINNVFSGVKLHFENGFEQAISTVPCGRGPLDVYAPAVEDVSELFLGLMTTHMPGGFHGVDLADVEEAFELFADGRLRLLVERPPVAVWTTQPSSGAYFFFAHFALLAAQVGPAATRPLWAELAKVMVRTQLVFRTAYSPTNRRDNPCDAPADKAWRPPDYCACNYLAPTHNARALQRLRDAYAGLDVDQLVARSAQNAIQTFPGVVMAGPLGFAKREFFETDQAERDAPQVDFGTSTGAPPQAPAPPTPPAEPAEGAGGASGGTTT